MIYIDKPKKCSFGRSSHMISDNSSEELINFAKKIGLKIEWIQKRGKYDEHFDVMNSKYPGNKSGGEINYIDGIW